LEVVHYLRPLLVAVVVLNEAQKLDVFLNKPGPLFKAGIQETVPVLSALLRAPEHLRRRCISEVKFFCHCLPVEMGKILHISIHLLMVDNAPQKLALLGRPITVGKIGLADAEPLEHAAAAAYSRNECCDVFPILRGELFVNVVDAELITVL
jgi:hypothetical protein